MLFQYKRQKQIIPTRDSFYYVNIIGLWVIHTLVTKACFFVKPRRIQILTFSIIIAGLNTNDKQ